MKRRLLSCLMIGSALVLALALAACGGSGGSSDESQIEEAIETSATTADPTNCTKFETLNFAEQGSNTEGQKAVVECEKEAKNTESNAKSVTVSKVEVEGSKATANAAVTGGGFDGQTVEIALVKEGEQWKLDEITGFAKLDQAKVVAALAEQFEKSGEVEASIATCIEEGFEEASQPEIEELLLSGSPEPIEELAKECS